MKTAMATVCIPGSLPEKLEAIAAAGFHAVEIFENDLITFPGTPREIRERCADLGLAIVTCQPFRDFEGMPDAKRQRAFDRAERKFDLLQELGTDLLFVCSTLAADAVGGVDRAAHDLAELAERAARRDMRVGFEALSWGRHTYDYRDAWEIVRRADHPRLGLILDSFHMLARDIDPSVVANIPAERIFLVQIADAPRLQMDIVSWSRHWRCLPGQGDFNLGPVMEGLVANGYAGYLSLEIFNDRFRAGSARSVALDGHRSLICLMDDTGRRMGKTLAGAVSMPPPTMIEGVEFIEFSVEDGERAAFETWLSQLGFVEAGRHRSKDVALWQQGDIRIILNSDPDGFARSYQISHGTSVCALGLRVGDAAATTQRASALLDIPHEGTIGPGELAIPAVRGVGGSLIYFLDHSEGLARWADIDFAPTGRSTTGAGLTRIDHISQAMHYEEMLTWLLFYTSLFNTRKTPSQAVIDPGGVVQSQVIESGIDKGAGLRLVLNGSQSHHTLSARFVTDFFGSGVQHIALATSDLAATVTALTAAGVDMLPVPENYYDDLEARTDLTPAQIARYKALNILYDRDAAGIFLQAYTGTRDGGFFFEFVERAGYAGYGAANASVRLAAQAGRARPRTIPRA